MHCPDVTPLLSVYLDGELSEAQAAPLRQHLLGCLTCRAQVQEQHALKAWFVEPAAAAVPAGFAARVTRRAFAGDRGLDGNGGLESPASQESGVLVPQAAGEAQGRLLSFVLQATAVAAAVLLLLALGIGGVGDSNTGELQADDQDLGRVIQEMEALNAAERAAQTGRGGARQRTAEGAGEAAGR